MTSDIAEVTSLNKLPAPLYQHLFIYVLLPPEWGSISQPHSKKLGNIPPQPHTTTVGAATRRALPYTHNNSTTNINNSHLTVTTATTRRQTIFSHSTYKKIACCWLLVVFVLVSILAELSGLQRCQVYRAVRMRLRSICYTAAVTYTDTAVYIVVVHSFT